MGQPLGQKIAQPANVGDIAEPEVAGLGGIPRNLWALRMNGFAFTRSRVTLEAMTGKLALQDREIFVDDGIQTHFIPQNILLTLFGRPEWWAGSSLPQPFARPRSMRRARRAEKALASAGLSPSSTRASS